MWFIIDLGAEKKMCIFSQPFVFVRCIGVSLHRDFAADFYNTHSFLLYILYIITVHLKTVKSDFAIKDSSSHALPLVLYHCH